MFMRRCVFGNSLLCFPCTRDLICGIFWELYLLFFFGSEGYLFGSVEELTHTGRLHLAFVLFGESYFSPRGGHTIQSSSELGWGALFWGKYLFQASNEFLCPSGKNDSHCKITFYHPLCLYPLSFTNFLFFF